MNIEDTKHRFEALKMARELLNEEYINRRAEDHNKWIAECDIAWKTKGIKLPYPAFAPYPSEAEILARASTLYSFISSKAAETAQPDTTETNPWSTTLSSPLLAQTEAPTTTTAPEPVVSANISEASPEPALPTIEQAPVIPKPLFAMAPTPAPTSALKNMLPSWLQNKDGNV